ncbi:MAG: adenosylcobinamide-phosphate synthase CbiB [Parvularculales bacterium]
MFMQGFITGQSYSLWTVLALAFILDAAIGDPSWLWQRVAHPVALAGRLIEWLEQRLNRSQLQVLPHRLRLYGLITTLVVVGLAASGGLLVVAVASALPLFTGLVLEVLVASTLIAFRGLLSHVAAVARGLDEGLEAGRITIAHIAGRNPDTLDAPGVARTAVESLAENLSDSVIAPLFWAALFGLPGLAAYKALNTLDSMIGYPTSRYQAFGFVAARLDDGANWIPARLTALCLCLTAFVTPKARGGAAFMMMMRDAPYHTSPNAGWPEAALAGALGFRLAGPRHYFDHTTNSPWLGDGRSTIGTQDIRTALSLCRTAGFIAVGFIILALVLVSKVSV